MNAGNPPLIITLELDQSSHAYFTRLRDIYFPKHCNYLQAHLTLFHNLPDQVTIIDKVLKQVSQRAPLELEITGIKNTGNGVAYTVANDELQLLHQTMQQQFYKYLIPRDKQKIRPHITIQNKVTAFKAKQTAEILMRDFKPFIAQGTGLTTWSYIKGPWQRRAEYSFNS